MAEDQPSVVARSRQWPPQQPPFAGSRTVTRDRVRRTIQASVVAHRARESVWLWESPEPPLAL